MKGIKDGGSDELEKFERRVRRSFGMGRISQEDFNRLIAQITELRNSVAALSEVGYSEGGFN